MPAQALLIVAHPNLPASRASRAVVALAEGHPGVKVHDLYDLYPRFFVPKRHEQQLLLAHDLIVLQYPTQWYSVPPLLKLWFDEVLEQGFAYGDGGDKLAGKGLLVSTSTAGSRESYSKDGAHGLTYDAFLPPLLMTARLCRMHWHTPQVFHGAKREGAAAAKLNAMSLLERVSAILGELG